MRKGWEIKKLGDVIEIKNGRNQQQVISETGQYPIMGSAGNVMGYSTDYICEAGTTIIGRKGNISKPLFINKRFWNVDTAFGFYPKDENKIDKKLIYYLCLSIDFEKLNRGTTIPSLVKTELQEIEISFPKSLPEQQNIVSILDEAFAAIDQAKENLQRNLQNAKDLFQSELNSIFENKSEGWLEKKMDEVLVKTETIDPSKKPNEEFIYLDVSSVNKETKEIESAAVLLGKDAPSRARKLIKTNDVIFATVRPTHSRVAIITEEYNEQVCSTGYFVLRANESVNYNLVYYFLLTSAFNKQMETLQKGASYPAVNDSEVKEQIICFPASLKEQKKIIKQLDTLSTETKSLENIYQQKLDNLEELKKSILQKAFSGELTLKLPALA